MMVTGSIATRTLVTVCLFVTVYRPGTQENALELFAPDVISTNEGEAFPNLSEDGRVLYFSKHNQGWGHHTVLVSRLEGSTWSEPEIMAFSGSYSDRAPRLSPDGGTLYFSSNRPLRGSGGYNLWAVERSSSGDWNEPEPLPASINTGADEWHASTTNSGVLYFSSRGRSGGHGRSDIYRAVPSEKGYTVENLGAPINSELSQSDLYVDPDERFMILVITDHPDGYGGDDLYASFNRNGDWSEPRNLGPVVNSPEYEYGPTITADGDYLYFTSHRRGMGDIYRIRLSALELDLVP
jgi:Tol biopolymer transport system component